MSALIIMIFFNILWMGLATKTYVNAITFHPDYRVESIIIYTYDLFILGGYVLLVLFGK